MLMAITVVIVSQRAQAQAASAVDHHDPRDSQAVEQQVQGLLEKMTLEEEIHLIGGDGMYLPGIARLGIAPVRMSDGPQGLRNVVPSTAYPAGMALASAWDETLAEQEGKQLGRDARARGVNIILGPGVNIYRAPMNGRNFEYFGEDPYLASRTTVNFIRGIQSQDVMATVKHFVANNSEYDRFNLDSQVDERTLREIYLPAFEAAVKEAHVAVVMVSHNLVNGQHMSQNHFLDTDVLKKDWGFDGILMPDWNATYDGVAAANAGLDLETPKARFMNAATLIPAIRDGRVSKAVIDDKVRRILRREVEYGLLSGKSGPDISIPLYDETDRVVARKVAEEGMVLLKNQNQMLPLDAGKLHTLAVIGPDAYPAVPTGGGSAHVSGFQPISFYTGIADSLGEKANVTWNAGVLFPSEIFGRTAFTNAAGQQQRGLQAEYFSTPDLTGTPVVTQTDRILDFDWCDTRRGGCPEFTPVSARWTGYYRAKTTGLYSSVAETTGNSTVRFYLDDKLVFEQGGAEPYGPTMQPVQLTAGHVYRVRVEYHRGTWLSGGGGNHFGFGIIANTAIVDPVAIDLARHADTVVLCVGFNDFLEREAQDRTFSLPFGQEELIREVVKANPRTIVVLTSGGAVDMQGWGGQVPALVEAWYSGQEAGTALAHVLFGDTNPSGKLPISFDRSWEQSPVHGSYYPEAGKETVEYQERLLLGYRYYDQSKLKPQFPFGYGLSYTSFSMSNLKVTPEGAEIGQPVKVSLDVKNTGSRAGDEIVQIYVGDPSAKVSRPVKELKAFARVPLSPGESRHVVLQLNRRSFAYYDPSAHGWTVDPGKFIIYAGDSSVNVPLQTSITLHALQSASLQKQN
ncbi:MAG: beta-glucosidase, partial [Acidobacteriaceae bacterium]